MPGSTRPHEPAADVLPGAAMVTGPASVLP
jgi:hypothetical protein